MTLVLVRHGTTALNESAVFSGWGDVELSPKGIEEAVSLRAELAARAWTSVVSSDLKRCMQTAAYAGFDVAPDAAWRELDFGTIEGLAFDDLDSETQAALMAFDGFSAPGGESVAALGSRVSDAIERLGDGAHLVFTHGGVIRWLLRDQQSWRYVPPAGVVELEAFTPRR